MSKEILDIVLILLPGLIAFIIIEQFTISRQIDFKKSIIYVIILNFFSFAMATIFNKYCYTITESESSLLSFHDSLEFTALVFIIAILLGLLLVFFIHKKYLYKIMPSNIVSKLEVWDDFFSTTREDANVVIRDMERKIMYYGTIKHYSIATEQQVLALHLVKITVFNMDKPENKYEINELYLPFDIKNMTVEFSKK